MKILNFSYNESVKNKLANSLTVKHFVSLLLYVNRQQPA